MLTRSLEIPLVPHRDAVAQEERVGGAETHVEPSSARLEPELADRERGQL